MIVEYNYRIKQERIDVKIPNTIKRKILGSKKYKEQKNEKEN